MLGAGADSDSELSLVLYTRACISNLFTLPFLPSAPDVNAKLCCCTLDSTDISSSNIYHNPGSSRRPSTPLCSACIRVYDDVTLPQLRAYELCASGSIFSAGSRRYIWCFPYLSIPLHGFPLCLPFPALYEPEALLTTHVLQTAAAIYTAILTHGG